MAAINVSDFDIHNLLHVTLQQLMLEVPCPSEVSDIVTEGMFVVPNKKGFVYVMNYLLKFIAPEKFQSLLSNVGLLCLANRIQEARYRNAVSTLIKDISMKHPEARIPVVTPSHMIDAGGSKITNLVLKLSILALTIASKQKLGPDVVNEWCPMKKDVSKDTDKLSDKILQLKIKQDILKERISEAEKERLLQEEAARATESVLEKHKDEIIKSVRSMPLPDHLRQRIQDASVQVLVDEVKTYLEEKHSLMENRALKILKEVHTKTNSFPEIFSNGDSAFTLRKMAHDELESVIFPLNRTITSSNTSLQESLTLIRRTREEMKNLISENMSNYSSLISTRLADEDNFQSFPFVELTSDSNITSPVHDFNISPLEAATCPLQFTNEKKSFCYDINIDILSSPPPKSRSIKHSVVKSNRKSQLQQRQSINLPRLNLPSKRFSACKLSVKFANDFEIPKYDEQLKESVEEVLNLPMSDEEEEHCSNQDSGLGGDQTISLHSVSSISTMSSEISHHTDMSSLYNSRLTLKSFSDNTEKLQNGLSSVKTKCELVSGKLPVSKNNVSKLPIKTVTDNCVTTRKPRKSLEALKSRLEAVKRNRFVNMEL